MNTRQQAMPPPKLAKRYNVWGSNSERLSEVYESNTDRTSNESEFLSPHYMIERRRKRMRQVKIAMVCLTLLIFILDQCTFYIAYQCDTKEL